MLKYTLLAVLLASAAFGKTIQLTTKNTVVFKGEVNEDSVADVEAKLIKSVLARKSGEHTYLVMDSPGGSITAGENFIQFAKLITNLDTVSIFAASMASAIVEALPGKRYVTENGTLMFHRAKGGFQGQFEDGEVESRLLYAKSIVRNMENRNAARMGIPLPTYKDAVKDELWLYNNEGVIAGAADESVDLNCSKQLLAEEVVTKVSFMGLSIDVITSACPTLSGAKLADDKADEITQENFKEYLKTYRQTGIFTP